MKKQLLTALIVLGTMLTATAQINIPDANFKAFLLADTIINPNKDGDITMAEATNFTGKMACIYKGILDMTGIENFVNMTELDCSKNTQMTSITLPTSDSLQVLRITHNGLTTLDISNCPNMKWLYAEKCNLTSINLGTAAKLELLDLNANEFTSLDISNLPSLTSFNLTKSSSKLDSLTIHNNSNLGLVIMNDVNLSYVSVNNLPKLNTFQLVGTRIHLSNFDLSSFTELKYFSMLGTQTTADTAKIDTVNISNLIKLKHLDLNHISMTTLISTGATNLGTVNVSYNKLTTLDLSNNKNIGTLLAAGNEIAGELDLSNHPAISTLWISNNNLTGLKLSNSGFLGEVSAGANDFTSLDLSMLKNLRELNMMFSKSLETLNIKNGNNKNMKVSWDTLIWLRGCPKLRCVEVDDSAFSNKYWKKPGRIDSTAYYSENCGGNASVADIAPTHITTYPNPTNGILHIAIDQPISQVRVMDINGKEVITLTDGLNQIDVTLLSPGIYTLLVDGNNIHRYSKFIKICF